MQVPEPIADNGIHLIPKWRQILFFCHYYNLLTLNALFQGKFLLFILQMQSTQ